MRMDRIPAYELILREKISDIHSEGYLLKHKKSGARVMVLKMRMTIRCLTLLSVHLRQTVPE